MAKTSTDLPETAQEWGVRLSLVAQATGGELETDNSALNIDHYGL